MLSALRNFSFFSSDIHFRGGRGAGLTVASLVLFFFVVSSFEIFWGSAFLGAVFFVGLVGIPLVSLLDQSGWLNATTLTPTCS